MIARKKIAAWVPRHSGGLGISARRGKPLLLTVPTFFRVGGDFATLGSAELLWPARHFCPKAMPHDVSYGKMPHMHDEKQAHHSVFSCNRKVGMVGREKKR